MKQERLEKIAEPLTDLVEESLNLLRLFTSGEKRELIASGQPINQHIFGPNYGNVLQVCECLPVYFSQLREMGIDTKEQEKEYTELAKKCDEIFDKHGFEGHKR